MGNEAHKDLVREQFAKTAVEYSQWATVDSGAAKSDVTFFAPKPSDRVLDLACGPGTLALKVSPFVTEVTGVDITEELLSIARKKAAEQGAANATFLTADVESLPFPDDHFDLVVCGSAMHHFPDVEKVFAQLCRVLKKGGGVGIIDIVSPEEEKKAQLTHRIRTLREPSHSRALKPSEFRALFARHGLSEVREKGVNCPEKFSRWARVGGLDPEGPVFAEVRRLFETSIEGDLTGWNVQRDGDDLSYERIYYYITGTK